MITNDIYNDIESRLQINSDLTIVSNYFPLVPFETINAIYNQKYRSIMTKMSHTHKNPEKLSVYFSRYLAGEDLLTISKSIEFSPCLLVRIILEHILGMPKKEIKRSLRDPSIVIDNRLRKEIQQCVDADFHYSPYADILHRELGTEYEYILHVNLINRGIPFMTENNLRTQGFSKTPDTKLQLPCRVQGQIIHWIESKAMFGDEMTFKQHLEEQLRSYINRFGPGIVVYWFGAVESLNIEKDIFVYTSFPKDITI